MTGTTPLAAFRRLTSLRSGQQRPRVLHSSDDKLVQKFLFQTALLFSNLLFISTLTVSVASLDSFNLSQHSDIFVSLLSVRHLQTSIRSSFCFQFACLNRLSSSLFFFFPLCRRLCNYFISPEVLVCTHSKLHSFFEHDGWY